MVARRAFVRSALTATLANAVSSFNHAATWTPDTALLIPDFQVAIADHHMQSVLRNAPLPPCRPDAQAVCWWCSARCSSVRDTERLRTLTKRSQS